MMDLICLSRPRFLGAWNAFARRNGGNRKRTLVMGAVGLAFCAGLFFLSCRVLLHFQKVDVIGELLARLLLYMVLMTFFSLLIFSHVISALSNLYLSKDLELLHSKPVLVEKLFLSRAVQTAMDSSWMLGVFGIPVFMGYAYVFRPGPLFYVNLIHLNAAMVIIAAGIGILVTMVLVYAFPAQRTRDLIMLLAVVMGIALYLMFRFLKPERLVNPESFFTVTQYLSALKAPQSPYLPTQWIGEILWDGLTGVGGRVHWLEHLLTWSSAATIVVVNVWVARAMYFEGFSKSQEAKKRHAGGKRLLDLLAGLAEKGFGGDLGAMAGKEIRTFFRDNTQWSQLLLLGALVAVYLYNFSALPLEKSPIRVDFLQNQLAFLNMALAGFVLSAVSARFVFPAVSAEGEAYWMIRSSPMRMRRFLWSKAVVYLLPLLALGEALVIFTNRLLDATRLMNVLGMLTMALMVTAIVTLGVGLGALYPKFRHENIAQVATGFGGVVFMIISTVFVVVMLLLEAGPVYILFMSNLRGRPVSPYQWAFIVASFGAALCITAGVIAKPMKMAERALEGYE